MFLKFSKDLNRFRMLLFIILYFLIAGSIEFEVFPKKIFTFTVLINMILCNEFLLAICARMPQIFMNYQMKNTGTLSFVTCFMFFGGSLVRTLTTLIEVPDRL